MAHDGKQGINMYDDSFDLILLDLLMPNKNGFDVLDEIRKTSNVPVFVVSNNITSPINDPEKESFDRGATKFFNKSQTRIQTLIEEVKLLCKNP